MIDPLGLGADGQLNEGASVEAEPAAALLQDLPRFVGEADGDVVFFTLCAKSDCSFSVTFVVSCFSPAQNVNLCESSDFFG